MFACVPVSVPETQSIGSKGRVVPDKSGTKPFYRRGGELCLREVGWLNDKTTRENSASGGKCFGTNHKRTGQPPGATKGDIEKLKSS